LCGDKAWLGQNVSTGHSASHVEVDEANQDEGVNEWVPFPGVLLVVSLTYNFNVFVPRLIGNEMNNCIFNVARFPL